MLNPTPSRCAGLFVPVFALRSEQDLGVGDTSSVCEMIDWCAEVGFKVLQLLPINETSDDNSPYNSISSHALDITTLALTPNLIPGLSELAYQSLTSAELLCTLRTGPVQYRKVKALKWSLCESAFFTLIENESDHSKKSLREEFNKFVHEEASWIQEYAVFRALVERNEHPGWEYWPEGQRSPEKVKNWLEKLEKTDQENFNLRVHFYTFVQWLLYRQWEATAAYAQSKGVQLMGDMPFGVSRHSADVWAQPEQFDLKWSGGAPPEFMFQPDEFTAIWGQNWGVPIYRWDRMEADQYAWWRSRVKGVARFFKCFRIDHVLGFYRVFSFPWQPQENADYTHLSLEEAQKRAGDLPRFLPHDDTTVESRLANQMHGEKILRMIKEAAGDSVIVAEDLGVVPDYVRPSLLNLGMSGFKIPMFERDEATREYKNTQDYPELTVATLSTHDHETMAGTWEAWWNQIEKEIGAGVIPTGDWNLTQEAKQASWEIYRTLRFSGLSDKKLLRDYEPEVREALIKTLFKTPSWLAIVMITDVFGLKMRFNVPGPVAESNWSERLGFSVADLRQDPLALHISKITQFEIKNSGRS